VAFSSCGWWIKERLYYNKAESLTATPAARRARRRLTAADNSRGSARPGARAADRRRTSDLKFSKIKGEPTMRIVLLGAPGSGKGTQTDAITERYGIPTVATGDLLRAEVAANTELGQQAKPYMDAGDLVPFDIVLGMIENGLKKLAEANSNGFMMDGFPRDLAQAEALDQLLDKINQPLDLVLFFEVDYEEIVGRLLGRGRADDNEETIRNRLRVYEEKTAPLIEYYTRKGLLRKVKGTGTIDAIGERIRAVLDEIA
jgi:adenylate kinase